MLVDRPEMMFSLSEVEVETLRRAAMERRLPFNPERTRYSCAELNSYGLVREAYNSAELRSMRIGSDKIVTSFDPDVAVARERLLVDAPFAAGTRKWQVPVDVCEWRVLIAEFPKGTCVEPHVHPVSTLEDPGGSMRTILRGEIEYAGRTFKPGDWFYIPNGIPYAFRTSTQTDTVVMYTYRFFGVAAGNRFSHPIELGEARQASQTAA